MSSPEPGENNSKHLHVLEFTQQDSSFAEKDLGVLGVTVVNTSSGALQGHTNSILGSVGRVLPKGLGRGSFSSISHCSGHT